MRRTLRTITVGPPTVGKSCLVARACGVGISGIVSTTSLDTMRKVVSLSDRLVELEIWDTAGQETYRSLNPMYYRNAKVALACFDAAHISEIASWIDEMHKVEPGCKVFLILTKSDLMELEEIAAIRGQAEELVKKGIGEKVFVTSAAHNTGIEDLFMAVAECVNAIPETESVADVHAQQPSKGCPC
jgi:small GTP-binding protein